MRIPRPAVTAPATPMITIAIPENSTRIGPRIIAPSVLIIAPGTESAPATIIATTAAMTVASALTIAAGTEEIAATTTARAVAIALIIAAGTVPAIRAIVVGMIDIIATATEDTRRPMDATNAPIAPAGIRAADAGTLTCPAILMASESLWSSTTLSRESARASDIFLNAPAVLSKIVCAVFFAPSTMALAALPNASPMMGMASTIAPATPPMAAPMMGAN